MLRPFSVRAKQALFPRIPCAHSNKPLFPFFPCAHSNKLFFWLFRVHTATSPFSEFSVCTQQQAPFSEFSVCTKQSFSGAQSSLRLEITTQRAYNLRSQELTSFPFPVWWTHALKCGESSQQDNNVIPPYIPPAVRGVAVEHNFINSPYTPPAVRDVAVEQ